MSNSHRWQQSYCLKYRVEPIDELFRNNDYEEAVHLMV